MCGKPRRRCKHDVSDSQADTDDNDDTEDEDDRTQPQRKLLPTAATPPVQHHLCQPTQSTPSRFVSWHRVTLALQWCRAVISVSVRRVPTTEAVAICFATQ